MAGGWIWINENVGFGGGHGHGFDWFTKKIRCQMFEFQVIVRFYRLRAVLVD